MTRDGGARPAGIRPATKPTVDADRDRRIADRRAQRRRQASLDMDRYIADTYGPEYVAQSRR